MKIMKFLPAFRVMDSDSLILQKDKRNWSQSSLKSSQHIFIMPENKALLQLILWITRAIYNILGNFKMILRVVWNSRYLFSQGFGWSQVILNILKTIK